MKHSIQQQVIILLQTEVVLSILLSGPLIVTLLSLSYFFLKTGVGDILDIQHRLESTKSNRFLIIFVVIYLGSTGYMITMLEKTIFYDGYLLGFYLISIISNVTSLWLLTSWN